MRKYFVISFCFLFSLGLSAQDRPKTFRFVFFPSTQFEWSSVAIRKMHSPYGDVDIKGRRTTFWPWKMGYHFGDYQFGLKTIMYGPRTPFGMFFGLNFQNKGFRIIYPGDTMYRNHRVMGIIPSVGIRISTGSFQKAVRFVAEAGTSYNIYFNYKGTYNNNIKSINNGFTGLFGLGIDYVPGRRNSANYNRDGSVSEQYADKNFYLSVTLQYRHDFYKFFNEKFSPDGIIYPYKGFSNTLGYFCLTLVFRGNAQFSRTYSRYNTNSL